MLKSFVGSYNATGLHSLHTEDGLRLKHISREGGTIPFWAILESDVVPHIERALWIGDRRTALAILARNAKDAGSILD